MFDFFICCVSDVGTEVEPGSCLCFFSGDTFNVEPVCCQALLWGGLTIAMLLHVGSWKRVHERWSYHGALLDENVAHGQSRVERAEAPAAASLRLRHFHLRHFLRESARPREFRACTTLIGDPVFHSNWIQWCTISTVIRAQSLSRTRWRDGGAVGRERRASGVARAPPPLRHTGK